MTLPGPGFIQIFSDDLQIDDNFVLIESDLPVSKSLDYKFFAKNMPKDRTASSFKSSPNFRISDNNSGDKKEKNNILQVPSLLFITFCSILLYIISKFLLL